MILSVTGLKNHCWNDFSKNHCQTNMRAKGFHVQHHISLNEVKSVLKTWSWVCEESRAQFVCQTILPRMHKGKSTLLCIPKVKRWTSPAWGGWSEEKSVMEQGEWRLGKTKELQVGAWCEKEPVQRSETKHWVLVLEGPAPSGQRCQICPLLT